ncbi:DUF4232 domain-containing protein [Streptomyces paludis]|uniref:DUF4232 domain-containing protein n=1 Tax=Streptomyces paludis TaxID=2282738 RepID=A0A345HP46_9ACTN|nr:DUF4232 domain-containing protein [Streptomyces paludis]AXG78470.1 DUF4232 domain-containing protein [Streptomyces paludis]
MRSRLATRSTRVILAVATTVALGAGLTACDDEDLAAGGSGGAAASTGGSGGSGSTGGSSDKGGTDGENATDDKGVGQSCGANDLDLKITDADGGHYLIAAKAKSGITCQLSDSSAVVSYGSGEKSTTYPAELMGKPAPSSIKLSGSAEAFATLVTNSERAEGAPEFKQVKLAVSNDDTTPVSVDLPKSADFSAPVVSQWYSTAADAVINAN